MFHRLGQRGSNRFHRHAESAGKDGALCVPRRTEATDVVGSSALGMGRMLKPARDTTLPCSAYEFSPASVEK